MQHIFGEHIGPTIEAYIDDIMVKTKKVSNLVDDLNVAFKCLKENNIRLNPEKCIFGVPQGMLLGFIVSERGIKANLEKSCCNHQNGPYPRSEGCAEGHGLPCGPQSLHLAPQREGAPSVSSPKEIRTLFVDPRG
jgi:hypothetical protein